MILDCGPILHLSSSVEIAVSSNSPFKIQDCSNSCLVNTDKIVPLVVHVMRKDQLAVGDPHKLESKLQLVVADPDCEAKVRLRGC